MAAANRSGFPRQAQEHPGLERDMRPGPDYGYETYRGHGRLRDKVALVTGGDSGIGRAVCLAFAREGADVAFTYLESEEPDARETARVVREADRRVLSLPADLHTEATCRQVVESVVREFGRVDVVVNNAAYQMSFDGVESIPADQLEHTFRVNILAMFWLCQAALPHMRAGGSIVNVTSIQAYEPTPELLPYATTKGAIVTFTKGLAQELASRGIRVNAIAPGPIWTPITPASRAPEKSETFGTNTPLGRPGQPVEVAPAFVLLASDDGSYISGEILGVTGGRPLP